MSNNTALVLGATGGIGGEVARQLLAAGWTVRGLRRSAAQATEQQGGIEWVHGDAMVRADVLAAAQGCSVIVHAVNPPGYRRWGELVLPMVDNTIAAAQAQGATIVLPGTVYNFGPSAFPTLREDAPQEPLTRKGAIRVQMEQRLRQASSQGCKVIVVRAGDFFGPKPGNNWFSQGLIKPGQAVKAISLPGAPGVGHQWAYLPDVARTMVELVQRREALEPFAVFHMQGHVDADGTQMAAAIRRVVVKRGGAQPKVSAFPWWLMALIAPFVPTIRELREMRYLWTTRVEMENTKLIATLGHEPHTPLDEAVEAALVGMGCMEPAPLPTRKPGAVSKLATAAVLALAMGSSFLVDDVHAEPVTAIDTAAPVVSRKDIVIDASLETVWKAQTDINAWTQWRPTVTAARFDGVLQPGAAFLWEEGGLKITSTVQEWTPMRRIVWTGPAQGIDAVHVWEFTPTAQGVQVHTEESWSGEVVQANAKMLQPMLDGALQDWLMRLKTVSEGRK